ncbi:MAG: DUF2752 domain-containing protein [Myxococcales bacterium]|jgi:hypothetical protein
MTASEPTRTASFSQRLLWLALAGGSAFVLAVAACLEPDARGYGTHTQLGLPPCGFLLWTGAPCPGCGLTTAFAHAIRGHWLNALAANPLGLALFLVAVLLVPLGLVAALRGWSLDSALQRFALHRWALALAGCAAALWCVRIAEAF